VQSPLTFSMESVRMAGDPVRETKK